MWHSGEENVIFMSVCVRVWDKEREQKMETWINVMILTWIISRASPLNPILKYCSLRWISSWAKQISSVYKLISCLHLLQNICSSKLTCMWYKDVSKYRDLLFSNGWFLFFFFCTVWTSCRGIVKLSLLNESRFFFMVMPWPLPTTGKKNDILHTTWFRRDLSKVE